MRVAPLGYEAALKRMEEIKDRIRSLEARSAPTSMPGQPSISGSIGSGRGFEPMDPFRDGATAVPSRPPQDLRSLIHSSAASAGVDPLLLESLVAAESDFNAREVSSKGALGLTQLMPETARSLGVSDPFDPAQNLNGGARYLAQLLRQFGDERLALAAYNAGPGAVKRYGGVPPYKETQTYVDRVMTRFETLRGRR